MKMKRKSIAAIMATLFLVSVFSVTFSVRTITNEDWPMFHHDLALSGVSDSTAPNTNATLWITPTETAFYSSPAVVDGMLYIGGMDGKLYALDANTGQIKWTFQTGGAIRSSPAVADGKVYFSSADFRVYALGGGAGGGALIWSRDIGSAGWSSPAVHSGNVFIGSESGWVFCLDAGTGAVVWNTNIGNTPNGPITVVNGKVYSGTHSGFPTLAALNEINGAVIWQYFHPQGGFINSNGATVVDGDSDGNLDVYFGVVVFGGIGQAIALNEANGLVKWTYTFQPITGAGPGPKGPGWSTSTPAVHNKRVFIGSDDQNMYALDAGTGAKIWSFATQACIWSAPAVADGKIFFGSNDHIFYALDEITGALVWSYDTSLSRIEGSPAVACGKVFTGNENGKVYCFATPVISVYVDIKPGSWPNPLNLASRGVLPVAICGTEDFDVTTIDPSTIKLTREGLDDGVSPIRWDYEDVATPWTGEPGGGHALGGDGYLDLTLKFSTQEVRTTLGLDAFMNQKIPLIITGNLKPEADGTPFTGQDYVWILELHGDANDDLVVNIFDGSVISAHWYRGPPMGPLGYDAFYDLNGDEAIDLMDAALVSQNWGQYWQP